MCLNGLMYLEHLEGVADEDISQIKHLPSIECLRVSTLVGKLSLNHLTSLKRIAVSGNVNESLGTETIRECTKLEALVVNSLRDNDKLTAVANFCNLIKSIKVVRCYSVMYSNSVLDKIPSFEHIEWDQDFDASLFENLLKQCSNQVKKLWIAKL